MFCSNVCPVVICAPNTRVLSLWGKLHCYSVAETEVKLHRVALHRIFGELHFVHLDLIIDQLIDVHCRLQTHTVPLSCAHSSSEVYISEDNVPCNGSCSQSRSERT